MIVQRQQIIKCLDQTFSNLFNQKVDSGLITRFHDVRKELANQGKGVDLLNVTEILTKILLKQDEYYKGILNENKKPNGSV